MESRSLCQPGGSPSRLRVEATCPTDCCGGVRIRRLEPAIFGEPPLFGIYHAPSGPDARRRRGVLLCPPIGHEHTRSHRALKTLAERLARSGHHVLRFDYRGMGDSSGDPADGGPVPWCHDVLRAWDELESLSGIREVQIVGLRLGAALATAAVASRAARATAARVSRLLLWDPVLHGGEFLDVAARMMSDFLGDPARLPPPGPGESRSPTDFLLGYSYTDALRNSLCEMDLRHGDGWPRVPTSIVLSEPSAVTLELAERLRAAGHSVACEVVGDSEGVWSLYATHEKTLRAGKIVQVIVTLLGASRP